jgi:Mn2+/Fe2+ NRAMP family transporter
MVRAEEEHETAQKEQHARPVKFRLLSRLGPGLITGASDDDPSGIVTYAQVGAQFGFCISWTMLFSFPLMAAIQEISGRMGRTTGRGLASNIRRHYPAWLLNVIVGLLFIANTINIGADLGAIAMH